MDFFTKFKISNKKIILKFGFFHSVWSHRSPKAPMAPSRVKRMKKWRRGSGRNEEEAQLHIWEFQFPDSIVIEFLCLWFLHPTRIAQGLFTPNVWIPKTIDGWLNPALSLKFLPPTLLMLGHSPSTWICQDSNSS